MNASDISDAISAMDRAVAFIKANVASGTLGKVELYCDLQFAAMKLKSEIGQLDVEVKADK